MSFETPINENGNNKTTINENKIGNNKIFDKGINKGIFFC